MSSGSFPFVFQKSLPVLEISKTLCKGRETPLVNSTLVAGPAVKCLPWEQERGGSILHFPCSSSFARGRCMGETFLPPWGNAGFLKNHQIRKYLFWNLGKPFPPHGRIQLFENVPFLIQLLLNMFQSFFFFFFFFLNQKLPPSWILRVNFVLLLAFLPYGARRAPKFAVKTEKSVFSQGASHLHLTGASSRPLEPGLVFFILSFQKFHPC